MLSLRKPTHRQLAEFLASQRPFDFTYSEVGATSSTPPSGYAVDRTRMDLGVGESTFHSACQALRRWEEFRLGWVEMWSPETPIVAGETVAIVAKSMGLWWMNACRIVSVTESDGEICRFGFTYGTLPDHVESGEERFLIEWHRITNVVSYDIVAFSRPNHLLAKIGYPLVRVRQRKFAAESAMALFRAIDPSSPMPGIQQTSSDRMSS